MRTSPFIQYRCCELRKEFTNGDLVYPPSDYEPIDAPDSFPAGSVKWWGGLQMILPSVASRCEYVQR